MSRLIVPVGPNDHIRGKQDAAVTLLEYGDYECPHCATAHGVVLRVLRDTGDIARFAFRNFPIAEVHPHAVLAAQAAEAAASQDRFWPMHDVLFENQDALELDDLLAYADALDLDVVRFARDLEAGMHLEKVRADVRSGARSGVNGTPTFFVDEVRFDAVPTVDNLTAAVLLAAQRRAG
jgi:protein-disulfide isomerase